ncbi:MAG TPA: hypothetical protein VIJ93_05100, partial [bacterium]
MSRLENAYLKLLHDKPKTWAARSLFSILKFLSFFFLAGWWTKRALYRSGILSRKRLACPVISVGN